MLKHESRIGKLNADAATVYQTIADFSRFESIAPPDDKMKVVKADADSCRFALGKTGEFGMRIIERKENELVKISSDETVPFTFFLWIQLKNVDENDTRVKVTLHADLNPMLKMVAKKPLTQFVDSLVDKLEQSF
ncbi:MAG: SRPBCC family protein [Salinivirgaceae bacterium]|jgi:carbon monoxide dehydrogenase subunit G|nr:SRPBCC family protein [Salinivirgaceae bacterium]